MRFFKILLFVCAVLFSPAFSPVFGVLNALDSQDGTDSTIDGDGDFGNFGEFNNEKIDSNNAKNSKNLRLEIVTDVNALNAQTLYIGQYVEIKYRVMLPDGARIVYTEFNPSLEPMRESTQSIESREESEVSDKAKNNKASRAKNTSVALIKEGVWKKRGEYFESVFTFKLLDSKAIIPSLVLHMQNNVTQDSIQTNPIVLNAQSLASNKAYCGVLASDLKVLDVNVEENDSKTNMISLEIEANNSNLEDFKLPNIKDQEFAQGSKFSSDVSRTNVVARISKDINVIEFSYFNISKREFIPLSVNLADSAKNINDTVYDDIKADLNPKSSFLKVTNLAMFALLAFLLILTIFRRSYVFVALSIIVAGFLIYKVFSNTYTINTLPNAKVKILPTKNSTDLLTIPNPVELEAIDRKNDYYKVNIDSKVGWISKGDTR